MNSSSYQPPFEGKTCFIITPISNENSEIRSKAYGLIDAVIRPVLSELGFKSRDPLEIANPGSITNHIITELINVDLVIANLTGPNPNVMYELAVRHAANKPVVTLAEHGTVIPFDIYAERTLRYFDSISGGEPIKKELHRAIEASMNTKDQDNPIYRAIQRDLLAKEVKNEGFENYVLKALDSLLNFNRQQEEFDFHNKTIFPQEFVLKVQRLDNSTIDDLIKNIFNWSPIITSYDVLKKDTDNAEIQLSSQYTKSEIELFISNQLRNKYSFSMNYSPFNIKLGSHHLALSGIDFNALLNRKS